MLLQVNRVQCYYVFRSFFIKILEPYIFISEPLSSKCLVFIIGKNIKNRYRITYLLIVAALLTWNINHNVCINHITLVNSY